VRAAEIAEEDFVAVLAQVFGGEFFAMTAEGNVRSLVWRGPESGQQTARPFHGPPLPENEAGNKRKALADRERLADARPG